MENPVKRKINIFGKVAKIITTVIIVFLLVAEGFMLVGGIVVVAVPKDSVTLDAGVNADVKVNTKYFGLDDDQVSVKIGGGRLTLGEFSTGDMDVKTENGILSVNGGIKNMHFDLNSALGLTACGMLSLAAIIVALFFFRALMKEFMVCESPFSEGVVRKMRNFAIALIPCLAVFQCVKAAGSGIISGNLVLGVDLTSIAFVVIIFILTMIFKYGTELQKEHDDTV